MSMSTRVVGFAPPDDQWKKMKAAWDACTAAGVPVPENVLDFFDHEPPDPSGVAIRLEKHECCSKHSADMEDGFQIDLRKVPAHIKIIRVYNSY